MPIHLLRENKHLTPENVDNPIVVISNYFFDTIPQDLFRVENGILEEGHITTLTNEGSFSNPENPNIINHLKFRYSYSPLESTLNYYESSDDNRILKMYRDQFNDATFLFPSGAFQVLRTFKKLSHSRMLLLAGDQGVCTNTQVQQWGEPVVSLHGSFSIAVSYHAIAYMFRHLHGIAFLPTLPNKTFVVMAGVLNQEKESHFHETELAFQEHLNSFQPVEFWQFVNLTEKKWKESPLDHVLLLIKLGNWDVMSLHAFFPWIKEQLPHATQDQKDRIAETIHRVWENYYPVARAEERFVTNLGSLLLEMGFSNQAQTYFERAKQLPG